MREQTCRINIQDVEVLPRGTLYMHGKNGINTTQPREAAAKTAEGYNKYPSLKQFFVLGSTEQSVKHVDGNVSVVRASSPYTERHWMIFARPDRLRTDQRGIARTTQLIACDPMTQMKYWQYGLSLLKAFQNADPSDTVVLTSNELTSITIPQRRSSRTLTLPHAHIISLNPSHVSDQPVNLPHLQEEQAVLQHRVAQRFIDKFQTSLPASAHEWLDGDIMSRTSAPFGIALLLNRGISDALKDPRGFQKFMRNIHNTYAKLAKTYETAVKRLRLIKVEDYPTMRDDPYNFLSQPSHRLTIKELLIQGEMNENNKEAAQEVTKQLAIIINPQFHSTGGALEASDLGLIRSQDGPIRYNEDVLKDHCERVFQDAQNLVEESNKYL